jgi:hypothetical protein
MIITNNLFAVKQKMIKDKLFVRIGRTGWAILEDNRLKNKGEIQGGCLG